MNIEHSTLNIERGGGKEPSVSRLNVECSMLNVQCSPSHARGKYDLKARLLDYAARIVRYVDKLPSTKAGAHIGGQLMRSGTSPAFNHGEAQAAESSSDFIHKMRICLKELRESERALSLVRLVPLVKDFSETEELLCETDELIRIFVSSIKTAGKGCVREDESEYQVVKGKRDGEH